MAHSFTTGLPVPQRTKIQSTACQLLAGLKRPAGYLVDVVPWTAPVRSHSDEIGVTMLIDAIGGRTPAMAVAVGDRDYQPLGIGARQATSQLELMVYHVSSHARNQQLGRQVMDAIATADDRADPGLHVMMEHAAELLIGQFSGGSSGLSIKQFWPHSEEELATTPAVTVWLQTYRLTATISVSEWRTATQLLTAIGFTNTDVTEPDHPSQTEHVVTL